MIIVYHPHGIKSTKIIVFVLCAHNNTMKTTVIIGGSKGIGLAVVQNLSGDNIINISREPSPVAGVTNIAADVSDTAALRAAFKNIRVIDTLIYCAGCSLAAPLEYVRDDDMRYLFDVVLLGAMRALKFALPALRESDNPKAIFLSSAGAVVPIAFDCFYSTAKIGLTAFSAAVRLECPYLQAVAVYVPATQTGFSFKRKIYTDCGEYDKNLKSAADALIRREQTGYTAEYVARRIAKLARKKTVPVTCAIGCANKFELILYRILPKRLKLFALRKIYNISAD